MEELKLGFFGALAFEKAHAKLNGSAEMKNTGTGTFFLIVLFGALLIALFTYLPGQLDERYAGEGQVIRMVDPSGDNPAVDLQYAEINQGNAAANLINARAQQRRLVIPVMFIAVFIPVGIFFTILFRYIKE